MNKKMIKWAILSISMLQMGAMGIAPALADIAKAFPESGISSIQMLMTFPGLVVIVVSLIAGQLSAMIYKKRLAGLGVSLFVASGLGAYLVNSSITILYLWAMVLGCGMGLFIPTATGLIADYFEGDERAVVMGQQTTFVNFGGILLTFVGGMLATISWQSNYLVYLTGIPALILCIVGLPYEEKKAAEVHKKVKVDKVVYYYALVSFLFVLIYNVVPTNMALFVDEAGFGNAATSGSASSIFLLGGVIAGLFFGKLSHKLNEYMFSLAFFVLFVGFMINYNATNAAILFIGTFIAGMGMSLLMPECILSVSMKVKPMAVTMGIAIVMAAANLATFLSPVIFTPLSGMTGDLSVRFRFLFTGVIALVFAIIFAVITRQKQKKSALENISC
ncbi:MAG: hypothetical protein PWQ97_1006 [Tepidanaerobacteraceae bacterium]|nr:hypothetical protein [Tepidanaerobacteraceae bacterium]